MDTRLGSQKCGIYLSDSYEVVLDLTKIDVTEDKLVSRATEEISPEPIVPRSFFTTNLPQTETD